MEEELQKIYDSEINVRIQSFGDADWKPYIMVGERWVGGNYDMCDLSEIIPCLQALIKEHLPDSEYAKSLKD